MHNKPIFALLGLFFYKLLFKTGPFFLFFALVLGIIGLPIPDELLLIGSGYLISKQKLHLGLTVLSAIAGSICGITGSYLIGRLVGKLVIKRYGAKFHLSPEKIDMGYSWFRKFGTWILLFGYYIPLFRHIIGFCAGGIKLKFRVFALYAYSGAILWSLSFLSLGYFFPQWFKSVFIKS